MLREGMTECAGGVALAGARQAEAEHVGGALEEVAALELAQSGQHACGEALRVERVEGGAPKPADESLKLAGAATEHSHTADGKAPGAV